MPEMPVEEFDHGGKTPDREQLLALPAMRRSVESSPAVGAASMVAAVSARSPDGVAAQATIVRELGELIKAIDRRLPHIERAGEEEIEQTARKLRSDAVARIAEIEREVGRT